MRHTPCGCRSADLVGVQPNFRLPPVSTMRRAKQCRYFARSLPPRKRHSRLMTVRRGCCQITTRRDSWRSHVHRIHTAQRVQPFKLQTRNGGVKGQGPLRSLGGPRGIFSHVREWPPFFAPRTVRGTPLPFRAKRKNKTYLAAGSIFRSYSPSSTARRSLTLPSSASSIVWISASRSRLSVPPRGR